MYRNVATEMSCSVLRQRHNVAVWLPGMSSFGPESN